MRFAFFVAVILTALAFAQDSAQQVHSEPKSATVPLTLDHNRIVIDVGLTLPDGSAQRIRAWVDNGNPELCLSRHVATLLGLNVICGDLACSAPAPNEIYIGGMRIPLAAVKEAKIPLKPVDAASVMAPGMSAEINIPSTILRSYDVLVDYPGHRFSIAQPGTMNFKGVSAKVVVNSANGLIQIPSEIEKKKYNLALDLGSSISFLTEDLFDKLAATHPGWPRMTGAVGSANMWGADSETTRKLMRMDRLQYGPLYLTSVAAADFPKDRAEFFQKRAGIPTAGLISSQALMNYRVGLDYTHSAVYFDVGRLFTFPDFDVIGLILRPEDDGRFTILGVADYQGKPSIPTGPKGVQAGDQLVAVDGIPVRGSTLGQVWLMLGGDPGKQRVLTIDRAGKQFRGVAAVWHFLGETEGGDASKGNSSKR